MDLEKILKTDKTALIVAVCLSLIAFAGIAANLIAA